MSQSSLIIRPTAAQVAAVTRPSSLGGGGTSGATLIPFINGAAIVDTNQPAARRELLGQLVRRQWFNFTGYSSVIFSVAGAAVGAAGAIAELVYSVDNGTNFLSFSPACTVSLAGLGTAVAPILSATCTIPAGAKRDVIVSVFTQDGNAVADPSYTNMNALVLP